MKRKLLTSKERKCPECKSTDVGITGESHKATGLKRHIGFECYACGMKFWISESDYKP